MENTQRKYDLVLIVLIMIVTAVLAALFYFLFFAPNSSSPGSTTPPLAVDNSWENVRGSGVLRVGTSADYPPFEYYDETTYQLDGFDIAMMQEIGQRLDVEVVFEDIVFDALGEALVVGQIDTAVSAITIDEERLQEMDFTNVYFVSEDAFLAQNGTDFFVVSTNDIVNRRVGVQRATIFEAWVRQDLIDTGQMPESNLFVYELATDAVRDLNEKRLDLVILDLASAQTAETEGRGRIAGQGLNPQRLAMAIPKGADALREQLNVALQGMYNDGRIHALAQQYLGLQPDNILPTPTPPAGETAVPTATAKPCVDSMQFVADVNLDDQNMTNPPQMPPGQQFTKIWRIRNSGTCTWDNRYVLNYVGGNVPAAQMGGQPTAIQGIVPPGTVYDIAVNLVSPIVPGTYQGFWAMFNPLSEPFGQRIWVGIEVPGPPTSTPLPTQPPHPSISFTVDKTSITAGECVTFSWNVSGASQVYFYEQGEAWQNYPVNSQVTSRLECPPISVTYELRVAFQDGSTEIRPQPIYVNPVPNAPLITSFILNPPYQLPMGQCVSLSWSVTGNVTAVNLTRNGLALWNGAPSSGTYQDCPPGSGQMGYLLEATGPGGQSRNQQYLQVVSNVTAVPSVTPTTPVITPNPTTSATAPPAAPVIETFTALPQEIKEGECVTVRWSVRGNNATVVRILRNNVVVGDNIGLNGSVRDCLTTAGVVLYRIEASNQAGNAFGDAAVTVNPATSSGLPLMGTDWKLTYYYDGMGALIAVLPGTEIDITFANNGNLTGSGGCNTYSGNYQANETSLTIGSLSVTNAVCSQPEGIMAQESAYLSILRTTATYRIVGNEMEVKNSNGVVILRYSGG